ncbi:hypothetical protein [Actinokineospora sp.]|uniref:hypothetical protein n=1 Tax=Actinokineospora sp. TaxID=1872133 RepID=UPI0040377653
MRVPPGFQGPAAKVAGVAVFAVFVAVLIALTGALGLWSSAPLTHARTTATVVTGVPCTPPGATEEVTYSRDGAERRAPLDACGHQSGESVEIAVRDDDPVVHLARATTGAATDARPMGLVLLVFAGIAGAGFVDLWRRAA